MFLVIVIIGGGGLYLRHKYHLDEKLSAAKEAREEVGGFPILRRETVAIKGTYFKRSCHSCSFLISHVTHESELLITLRTSGKLNATIQSSV